MSPQKIEVIDNILAERSSLLLENWQKFFKKCPHQELVSKSVEISSKFGEIWQEIVTKYSFLFLLKPKIWNSAPPPPANKSLDGTQ